MARGHLRSGPEDFAAFGLTLGDATFRVLHWAGLPTPRRGDSDAVSVMQRESSAGYLTRAPRSSGLADVLEILLDRGLVIDAYVRVSLVGIELLTVDLRVVIASVDTYLRFAEAVNRLDLRAVDDSKSVPELFSGGDEDEDEDGDEDEGRSGDGSRSRGDDR
jgi:gas vesicle structural protein